MDDYEKDVKYELVLDDLYHCDGPDVGIYYKSGRVIFICHDWCLDRDSFSPRMWTLVFCESQENEIIHDLLICRDVYERQMVLFNPRLYQLGCMWYVQTFEERQNDKS